jgi:chromosome segregation ATPase
MSKLITRNEQLTQQKRVLKERQDSFKKKELANFEKQLNEKDNEIAVLKEMIRSTQTQLKSKEAEVVRLRKKVNYAEAQSLAARQLMTASQASLTPQSRYPAQSQHAHLKMMSPRSV